MLHSAYIIHETGVCIFSQDFSKIVADPQLVAGFLSALGQFSTEITQERQQRAIKTIELSNLKFIFSRLKDLIFAVLINDYDDDAIHLEVLEELKSLFLEKFGWGYQQRLNDMSFFAGFEEFVTKFCRTTIKIALLGRESHARERTKVLNSLKAFSSERVAAGASSTKYARYQFPRIPQNDFFIWNVAVTEDHADVLAQIENAELIFYLTDSKPDSVFDSIEIVDFIREKLSDNIKINVLALGQNEPGTFLAEYIETILGYPTKALGAGHADENAFAENVVNLFETIILGK